jgi:voltage-gated potassium channel
MNHEQTAGTAAVHGGPEPVVMALGRGWVRHVYEWTMIGLAVAVAWMLTLPDEGWVRAANIAIWAVFTVDYFSRLAMSTDRRAFFRSNVFDLIAIIPFDVFRLARLARLGRLVRLLRAATVFWRATRDMRGVLGTNGLGYVIAFALGTVTMGSLTVWAVEDGLDTFGDAIWWSIVTATTVGYGDIAPEAPLARVVAVVLMLVGIGTLGMITGSIATYFISGRSSTPVDPDLEHVRARLDRWHELTTDERVRLVSILAALADTETRARTGEGT